VAEHEWRNLAEDAISELFKAYVGDQMLMVIRQQIGMATFIQNVTTARDRRADAMEAINSI
jgi:hypothetical protein